MCKKHSRTSWHRDGCSRGWQGQQMAYSAPTTGHPKAHTDWLLQVFCGDGFVVIATADTLNIATRRGWLWGKGYARAQGSCQARVQRELAPDWSWGTSREARGASTISPHSSGEHHRHHFPGMPHASGSSKQLPCGYGKQCLCSAAHMPNVVQLTCLMYTAC